jgi:hypothetical protein
VAPEAVSITLLGPGVTELTKANMARGRMKAEDSGRNGMVNLGCISVVPLY